MGYFQQAGGKGKGHWKCLGKDLVFSEDQQSAMHTCMEEYKARSPTQAPGTEEGKGKHGKHGKGPWMDLVKSPIQIFFFNIRF